MKKLVSLLLSLVLFTCTLSLPCSAKDADETDMVRCAGWSTAEYFKPEDIYEIVLHPRFVKPGNIRVTNARYDLLEENKDYTVERMDVEGFGECYVLRVEAFSAYLQPGSFLDKDGNGNEKLHLTNAYYHTKRRVVNLNARYNAATQIVEQGTKLSITFETNGTVAMDDNALAENVRAYTLEYADLGEHKLTMSVGGLPVASYDLHVKTAAQIREDQIAALEKELSETSAAFFRSLPLALLTLPLAPLAIFGFLWPFAPLEIAGRYFDLKAELRRLKAQR